MEAQNSTGVVRVTSTAPIERAHSDARSTNATLVINYDLLATMPAASYMQPTSAQPPMPVKGEPTQRNADVDELRKELQDIKKKLAEQEAERSGSKP